MTILKAGDIGRVLVRATDNAKIAIGPRATANDHTLLVASDHTKLPMLSDRYASYNRLKLLQRREPLAHMEPRVHLRHVGEGGARSEGTDDQATETPVADSQGIDAIRVQSATRTCIESQCLGRAGQMRSAT